YPRRRLGGGGVRSGGRPRDQGAGDRDRDLRSRQFDRSQFQLRQRRRQEQVLAIPAPSVLFAEFGDWSMKFNLICFVDDIEQAERTRSDINFEVLRRLREAGLRIAYP